MKSPNATKTFIVALTLLGSLNLISCAKDNGGGGGGAPADPNAANGYATTPQPCNTSNVIGAGSPQYAQPAYGYGYGYGQPGYQQPGYQATAVTCQNQQGYYGNPHVLPQAWPHGAWMWPTQWQPQVGNCGCQAGYQPVHHTSFGLACAPQAYFNGGAGQPGYGGGVQGGYSYYSYGVSVGIFFNWMASFGPAVNNQNLNIPQTNYGAGTCGNNTVPAQGCDVRVQNSCGSSTLICQPVGGGSSIGVCVTNSYYY